jgi:hypothetical protein
MMCSIGDDRHRVAIRYIKGNSESRVLLQVAACYKSSMDNKAIRHLNLRLLTTAAGSHASLAEQCDLSAKYLDQVLTGFQGKADREPRGLGKMAARALERGTGHSIGWMDERHDDEWAAAGLIPPPDATDTQASHVTPVTVAINTQSKLYLSPDESAPKPPQHVPLLTWETCLMARDDYDRLTTTAPTYPIGDDLDGRLIALTMSDDSMVAASGASFPAGTLLIFDVDMAPAHLDYVLFRGPDERAHFRQYILDVGRRRLHPLNPRFEPLPAPPLRDAYLGVLVLAVPPAIYRRTP